MVLFLLEILLESAIFPFFIFRVDINEAKGWKARFLLINFLTMRVHNT